MRLIDGRTVVDTTADPRWEPMRVRAILAEPIVTTDALLMLDGPVAKGAYYLYIREHGRYSLPPIAEEAVDFELPFATWTRPAPEGARLHPSLLNARGEVWGWCVSRAEADWICETKVEVRKRPPIGEFARYTDAKDHHTSLGPMKAKDVAFPARVAWELRWYALGDRDAVAHLLSLVPGLGKLCHHGWGYVERWIVEPMGPQERDRWMARHFPASGGRVMGVRAPYHHRHRGAPCS